jgi:hypothetical protein
MNPNCPYSPNDWINFCDYSMTEIVLVLVGTILWNIAYFIIIRDGLRNKYIEMPYLAGASNIAWEFAWGFLLETDMGKLFVWGLRIWFLMDVFIFYLLLKYGDKQINNDLVKKSFKAIFISVCLYWIPIFYFMSADGYDTSMGATSAYLITVEMGALYIFTFLARPKGSHFSYLNAWLMFVGNALMSIFVFIHYPQQHFLQMLCVAVFILDLIYVLLLRKYPDNRTNP